MLGQVITAVKPTNSAQTPARRRQTPEGRPGPATLGVFKAHLFESG
jgi:hypothetical protein